MLLANVAKYYDVDKKSCTNTLLALTGIKIRDEQTKKHKQENRVDARKKRKVNQKVDENDEIEEPNASNKNSPSGRVCPRNNKKSVDDK